MMVQLWEAAHPTSTEVHVHHPKASRGSQHPLETAYEKFHNVKATTVFPKINTDQASCSFSVKY